jgi:hypothetical protein
MVEYSNRLLDASPNSPQKACSPLCDTAMCAPDQESHLATPDEINADMLSFWNGKGVHTWVARQEHTDITLEPVTDALLAFAAPRTGERVVDI